MHPHCHAKKLTGLEDKDGTSCWFVILFLKLLRKVFWAQGDSAFLDLMYSLVGINEKIASCFAVRSFAKKDIACKLRGLHYNPDNH